MFKFSKKKRGDEILRIEEAGEDLDICTMLKEVRSQGATDNDIREWWNMPDEQHLEIIQEDDEIRNKAYEQWLKDGDSKDEAISKVRKGFPIFEEYMPGILHTTQDSNLPYELSPRISRFFSSLEKISSFKDEIEESSSMNAFIRSLIKRELI